MKRKDPKRAMYHEEYRTMREDLDAYRRAGVLLVLSGRASSPGELAYVCTVRERGRYMGDYIPDENGRLCEVRFDRIE